MKEDFVVKGLAHLCFVIRDLQASLDFYCGKLGLTPGFEFRRESGELFGMYLHVGGRSFIEIFQGTTEEFREFQSYRHLSFEVDDMEATVRELREKGVTVTDPKLGGDRAWQAWTKDPDGNPIELHCYRPDSKQVPYLRAVPLGA